MIKIEEIFKDLDIQIDGSIKKMTELLDIQKKYNKELYITNQLENKIK